MTRDALERRYAQSIRWRAKLEAVTPGGAQTRSKRAAAFGTRAFPAILERGAGGHVWCVDGHEYIDCIAGLAAIGIGYADDTVTQAVIRQATKGASFSLATKLEYEVAERLIKLLPWVEQVRFVKTGSEATEAAIRVARRATGRAVIAVPAGGYHSWHSWFCASKPEHPGVPSAYESLVRTFTYNDLASLEAALAPGDVAAVMLEPMLLDEPHEDFLPGVRRQCTQAGAVLIFDEMVCGFRLRIGGGTEAFNVRPDLMTYGKALANGYPLACLAGPKDFMMLADVVSGTFGGEAISLAACNATLKLYEREGMIDSIWQNGRALVRAITDGCGSVLPIVTRGACWHPKFECALPTEAVVPHWQKSQAKRDELNQAALTLFVQTMAAHGVLLHPAGCNPMARHTPDDMIWVRDAAESSARIVAQAVETQTVQAQILGAIAAPGVRT